MNGEHATIVLSRLAVRQEHTDSIREALLFALYVMRRRFRIPAPYAEIAAERARLKRARER